MTRTDKIIVATCIIGLSITGPRAAKADLPTIDFAQLLEWTEHLKNEVQTMAVQAKQFATQNLQWLKQVDQYATQVNQYSTEVASLYSMAHLPLTTALMSALGRTGLGSSLPVDPYAVQNLMSGMQYASNGGLQGLLALSASVQGFSSQFLAANTVYRSTDGTWTANETNRNANAVSGMQAAAMAVYTDAEPHFANLKLLQAKLVTAATTKDAQDIQAQIQVEQTWIAHAELKFNTMQGVYRASVDDRQTRVDEKLHQDNRDFLNVLNQAGG